MQCTSTTEAFARVYHFPDIAYMLLIDEESNATKNESQAFILCKLVWGSQITNHKTIYKVIFILIQFYSIIFAGCHVVDRINSRAHRVCGFSTRQTHDSDQHFFTFKVRPNFIIEFTLSIRFSP